MVEPTRIYQYFLEVAQTKMFGTMCARANKPLFWKKVPSFVFTFDIYIVYC